jgi:hypothetical protein
MKDITEKEANSVNNNGKEVDGTQVFNEHGFSLDYTFNGKRYRLYYDRETWFTGVGYELEEGD